MAGSGKNTQKKTAGKRQPTRAAKKGIPLWAWFALALVVFGGLWVVLNRDRSAGSLPREISVTDAYAKREAGAYMLDVREVIEWEEYHMPEATLIPQGELSSRLSELPKDKEIVVVCRSGNRSADARDRLLAAGFTKVTSMAGGMVDWRAAGYPVVSGP